MQRERIGAVGKAGDRQRPARGVRRAREPEILAAEAGADLAVLQHRHLGERLHDLVRAGEAATRDVVGLVAGDVGAGEHDAAGVRREDAVDQVEQGRLAGAVRPDQAEDLALAHLEREVAHGLQAAEALAHLGEREDRRHSSTRWLRGKRVWMKPIRPEGKNSTMTSSSAPEITSWKCEKVSETSR